MLNLKKRFHPSKNEQNHYHDIEHLLTPKREDAQDSDLVHFLEDVIKVKNFLRLSHLYQRLWYNCTRYSLKLNSNFCFKRQNIWCLSISKFSRHLEVKIYKIEWNFDYQRMTAEVHFISCYQKLQQTSIQLICMALLW